MNKEEFKAKANQTIDEVSAKINELKAKRESVQYDAKSKYEESLKDLESRKADLESKFKELENASDDKWEEVFMIVVSKNIAHLSGIIANRTRRIILCR